MEKTKPNTTKARIHQSKEMHYNTIKINKKLKPVLGCLLRHPAWKRSGSILKGKDKEGKVKKKGQIPYKQANNLHSAEIESKAHYAT